ncbi:16S rRNA (cytosine(1402)-N(4))-methyltransferase [Candidatus Daviesbacteria bacterium RIFCSPLOWO2_02_FULL_38_18]|uniref:Ribosomal RNA small subunit methyltransferase H n=1 Tax=Candidatus Daviesbacteria bacterium GW2011_GWF2_38_6 TaxID=1618432 RepID=A0A0G0KFR1_9BACT|nr:MAG: Ribosomal RNA small subunit methyltransferase H [Candidatus Daviesbacteria bacterium GW2011_GWA2_38_17]KKQ78478.1 MAG: Ribosomal RNA small subunit methyltransferase H [Candidatus Daviesbacteria bacterium GW2011_GWF2_38_6]OGE26548.1 MAG: 16S rRNA (cytosine(1402)-N(4))-methyltransferase [Candidatus Daviesbacteria bacterium RIFCSPHIGHO2_02_FULL_39_41]OGE45288.1 MAG: 16S rRNA (cytosine(1402)-N(4))-methyltransferase [Candidatus Daviesbacteria bacterium RIFCSPHIGHO2_12_FULL_38_25]OGE68767.1 M
MEGYHRSVLLGEAIDALEVKRDEWYLDCTLGDGGHSLEIIKRDGKVVGIDTDPEALARAQKRFSEEGIKEDRFKLVLGNFRDLKNLLPASQRGEQTETKFAGVLFDLGVSSLQLETPERGFSFGKEGPLDMRMDPSLQVQAKDLLQVLSRKELYELFKNLGEEKYSWALANALVSAREIKTTVELARMVERVVGGKRGKVHPATRVFQALRIAVNSELDSLSEALPQALEVLNKNGRIVVISFHSLEDRIVKNLFKRWKSEGMGEVITKKPVMPSKMEVDENPRSRSAKMRIFQK